MRPEDLKIEPLENEFIPDEPPEGVLKVLKSEADPKDMLTKIKIVPYLSRQLLESAWRLVEISKYYEGNYQQGMEIPLSSKAAATGAIVLTCAAFEATLNEEIFNLEGDNGGTRLLTQCIELSPPKRFEAIANAADVTIDWGCEPFQSLKLLLTVRNCLVHHEVSLFPAEQGFWPVKKLRDITQKINSPYPVNVNSNSSALEWHQHILAPAGAEWAVNIMFKIIGLIDEYGRIYNRSNNSKKQ